MAASRIAGRSRWKSIERIAPGLAGALIFLAFTTGLGFAETQHSQDPANESSGGHHFHRHHIAVFLGATNGVVEKHGEDGHDQDEDIKQRETDFSIGADYQFRLHRYLGVGALIDYATGDLRTTVFAAGAFIHPFGEAQILTAGGFESHEGKRHPLFRLGFYYDFTLTNRLSLTPNLNIDFVNGNQVYVYGVALGVGF